MVSESPLDTEKLDALLPAESVHSLRQVQAVYGALAEAASGVSTPPGQEEYSLYFTPSELGPFLVTEDDQDRFLVSVKVDFTGDEPSYKGIEVVPLSPDRVAPLGYARQPAGRAIDHSITRRGAKGGSSASTVATYCEECLTRWTNGDGGEPAVGRVADEHADGWLIDELAALGAREDVQQRIETDSEAKITGEPRVVATVQLKLDPATLEAPPVADEPDWFFPGEVPVFNEAMRARKTWKLVSKNIGGDGVSEGEAACMVTGEECHVVGTAEDPFALFTLQHTEKFDELERERSWREHPISADAALLLDAGTGLLDACRRTRNGLRVYTLPYFTTLTDERAEVLYRALSQLQDADLEERHMMVWIQEQVERHAERVGDATLVDALRFYVVAIRDDQGDVFVFNEEPDATIYPPREIAEAHCEALASGTFGRIGFEQPDDWRHIHPLTDRDGVVSGIVSGSYAQDTVSFSAGSDGAMANEPSEWLAFAMLAGERVDRAWLLDQYVTRLAQQRERDDESRLSGNHLLTQLAQLDAFAGAGLLVGSDGRENRTELIDMTDSPTTDDVPGPMTDLPDIEKLTADGVPSIAEIREYRLDQFLSERTKLLGDESENRERRGGFLIGVLLGELSTHQRKDRGMNRTFANRYQAEDVTLGQLTEIMTELLSKDSVYEAEHRYSRSGSCFPETSGRLSELAGTPPTEWSLSLPDVRFHFALGVTYGLHARNRAFELREQIESYVENESPSEGTVNA